MKPFEIHLGYKKVAMKTGKILLGNGEISSGDYYIEFAKNPELKRLGKIIIQKDALDMFIESLRKLKEN